MLEKKYLRKYTAITLLLIPILYSIGHAVLAPDFLIRGFDTDVSHDYFYNGLLILDGELPQGSRHPGTPYFYIMALLQYILAGGVKEAIKNASIILKVASILGTVLPLTLLYITGRSFIKDRWLFFITAVLAVYSIPSTFYYTTHYGPDFSTPILTLAIGFILLEYLLGQETLSGYIIGGLTGVGLAIKMSFLLAVPPVLVALFIPSISKHRNDPMKIIYDHSFRRGVTYISSAILSFFILTLPDVRNYPRLFLGVVRKFIASSGNPDYGISNIIYIQQYLLIIVVFTSLFVTIYRNKHEIDSKFPIQFWGYFITSLLIFLISFSSPFESGQVSPVSFRQVSVPTISFVWIAILFIDEVGVLKQIPIEKENINSVLSILLVFLLISSASMALYNYQLVNKEYSIGAEANEVSNELENVDGRVAIDQRGPFTEDLGALQNTYGPTVFFHLHGNNNYAYEHFTPVLINIYPNFTHVRPRYMSSMNNNNNNDDDDDGDMVTSVTHPSELPEYLRDTYKRSTNTDPHPRRDAGLYGGAESNVKIECLIYPTESNLGIGASSANKYDALASEAGFENYTIEYVNFSEGRKHISETEFVKICKVN